MDLENILVPDIIHFHKQTGEVVYSDLLKSTLKVSRLQSAKHKVENQLRQERVDNKAHQHQIKKLQGDILAMDRETIEGKIQRRLYLRKKTLFNN